jgi:UDP-2,3-diacylglucosamine hydrolase
MDDPVQETLAAFLDAMADGKEEGGVPEMLVILGDIFNNWNGYNPVVERQYGRALEAFRRLAGAGVRIVCIEGNHDFHMEGFFSDELKAEVHIDSVCLDIDGRHIYLSHGDTVEMNSRHALWRGFLHSRAFKIVTRIMSAALIWRIAAYLSAKSRMSRNNQRSSVIEERQKRFAKGKVAAGIDAVVMAHSHVAGVHDIHGGGVRGVYANPGAWTDGTYLLYRAGSFHVKRYDSRL